MSVRRPSRRHAGLVAGLASPPSCSPPARPARTEPGADARAPSESADRRRRRRPDVRHRQRPDLDQPGRHRLGQRHPVRDPPARRLAALAGPGRRLAQAVAGHGVGGQRRLDAVHVHAARRRHVLRRHAVRRRLREGELRRHRRGGRQELRRRRASSATGHHGRRPDARHRRLLGAQRGVPAGHVDRRARLPRRLDARDPVRRPRQRARASSAPGRSRWTTTPRTPRRCSRPATTTRGARTAATNTGKAHLDSVTFQVIPEAGVRTGALTSDQVDVIGGVQPHRHRDARVVRASAWCTGPTPASRSGSRSTRPARSAPTPPCARRSR